jgi:precorrin-6Y C5,15-methyltransferase (decarboxylating)
LLWDIGLGAGSVAIEWLLQHASLRAIGIEARSDRAGRAARNAARLGVPELEIVQGAAPEALAGLARPDAVFIGGGMMDDGVFDAAWSALKPGGRLVANAVSLETEAGWPAISANSAEISFDCRSPEPIEWAPCLAGGRRCRSRNGE